MPKVSKLPIQERIGLRIKDLRNNSGLTQEGLALQAGLDRTYINSVENGRRNISAQALHKISIALEISFRSFFDSDMFDEKGKI